MRAAARRILDQFDADAAREPPPSLAGKVNALEAPLTPDREVIPDRWTPEHVGKRIVEAFETLAKLPPIRGPRAPGNSWPQHVYDWEDRLAQETLAEQEKARRRRSQNRTVLRPTSEDLRRLDVVMDWLSELHAADAELCAVLQVYCRLRALGRSIKEWARENGRSHQSIYRQRDKALANVAEKFKSAPVW